MTTNNRASLSVRLATGVLLLFSCFFMYDFYKSLSGLIAGGFREPLVMLPMILAFLLPVLCFFFFFYDWYVRAIPMVVRTAYSLFVALCALADFALILSNLELYASNHALGVYDALPSVFLHFPYDMLILLPLLAALQILHLIAGNRPNTGIGARLNTLRPRGTARLHVLEYLVLCVLAIIVFIFTGAGLTATVTAFDNLFYDPRYLFLLGWVTVIPMANLILLTFKPRQKAILGAGIAANLLFGLLFLVCELTHPDFLIHVGKPLFMITFSISLPIEPALLLGIMTVGTVILAVRLILITKKK